MSVTNETKVLGELLINLSENEEALGDVCNTLAGAGVCRGSCTECPFDQTNSVKNVGECLT